MIKFTEVLIRLMALYLLASWMSKVPQGAEPAFGLLRQSSQTSASQTDLTVVWWLLGSLGIPLLLWLFSSHLSRFIAGESANAEAPIAAFRGRELLRIGSFLLGLSYLPSVVLSADAVLTSYTKGFAFWRYALLQLCTSGLLFLVLTFFARGLSEFVSKKWEGHDAQAG